MISIADPFAHHPELKDKIKDPETSFFRAFSVERFLETHPEQAWILPYLNSDDTREQNRRAALKERTDGDLWVFAYGSLMWDPAFRFSEVRRARTPDHERRFILKDILGGRGNPDVPGLMAALDNGSGCDGLLFRIPGDIVDVETEILWRREYIAPGYIPSFVTASTGDTNLRALAFVADHDAEQICGDISRDEQIACLANAAGILGTSVEYLENICSHFEILGIDDEECSSLLRRPGRSCATMQSRPVAEGCIDDQVL